MSPIKAIRACLRDILCWARGREVVLWTRESIFLSQISLIMHPAERIRIVPAAKTSISPISGLPPVASHRAQLTGHQSSNMPTGLFKRVMLVMLVNRVVNGFIPE
jgi:hypothetical protein